MSPSSSPPLFLTLAPWGVESNDMFDSLRAAYFGFAVDGVTISLSSIVTALALFVFLLLVDAERFSAGSN